MQIPWLNIGKKPLLLNSLSVLKVLWIRWNKITVTFRVKVIPEPKELPGACICGKNGFNNNPDVRNFKLALKRLLLQNSAVTSKNVNSAVFEENYFNHLFSLKWLKNRALLQETGEVNGVNDRDILPYITQLSTQSPYHISILAYIAG